MLLWLVKRCTERRTPARRIRGVFDMVMTTFSARIHHDSNHNFLFSR